MAVQAGIRIGVDGEREYRQALQNINQQTKELNSEMKLLESSFTSETSEMEKASAKSALLEKQIANQATKVDTLTDKYNREQSELSRLKAEMERATAEYGANSKEAEQATTAYNKFATQTSKTKTELNRAQAGLNDLKNELEETKNPTKEEGKAVEEVGENLDKAGKNGSVFGDVLKANVVSEAIIGGFKAMGQAISSIAKGLADTVTDTVQWADDLATLSVQTGITTDRLQEMEYMSNLVDVDVTTITGSLAKMTRNMSNAAEGTGDAAEAFEKLGINVADGDGNLRDAREVFYEVVDALGGMENATERDAAAMQIFGRSAQELNPLISAGSETLEEYAAEAHEVGYVIDEEMLGSMLDTSDALDRIQKAAEGTKRRLVAAFAPTIANALERLTPSLVEMGESLTDLVGPAVDALADGIEWVTDQLNRMDDASRETAGKVAMLAIALGPTVPILSNIANIAKVAGGAIAAIVSNPALLAITAGAAAIGAVTVAIIANEEAHRRHTQAIAEATSQTSNYTAAERDMLTAMNDSISAMEASRAATAEATDAISFQRDRAVELIDELLSLADEQGNVSETDQAHAQVIIDELNRAYGLEIELIDGQIQGYDSLRDSVYEVIEAKTAEALIERHRDDYLTALEAQDDLLQSIRTSRYNAAEAEEEYNRNAQAAARATAYLQEHQYEMTRREYDAYLDYVEGLEAGAATAHENWMQSIEDEQTYSQAYLENSRLIQNYDAAQVAAQRGNTQEVIDLMTGRTNAWTDYGNTVSAETSAALNAMEDEVQRAGEYALELRTNWENGVDGYTEDMVEEAEQSYLDILAAYSGALDDAGLIGSDFVQGLINGLDSRQSDLAQKAKNIGSTVSHGVRDVLGIASPSKVAAQIGEYFGDGLVIGLDRSAVDVGDAAAAQADEMVAAFAGVNDVFGSAAVGQLLGGGAASNAVNYGGVSITVNANDEMTAQEIAEAVMEQMQSAVERKGAVYA